MNATPTAQKFQRDATAAGLSTGYSGKVKKMLVNGPADAVKRFLRLQCLKGKAKIPFAFGQGTVS
jgi:hypothetical protein